MPSSGRHTTFKPPRHIPPDLRPPPPPHAAPPPPSLPAPPPPPPPPLQLGQGGRLVVSGLELRRRGGVVAGGGDALGQGVGALPAQDRGHERVLGAGGDEIAVVLATVLASVPH